MKKKKIIGTVGDLVVGGVGIGMGSALLGKLPASAATTKVQAGMTTFAGFYPLMASAAGTGIVFNQLKGLNKKVTKKKYKGGY